MNTRSLTIVLTDDDLDDQEIFSEALQQIDPEVQLLSFPDGEQLMHFLREPQPRLPDLIFLDLNMPVKNGKTCLAEIRAAAEIKDLPVAIYSTSSSRNHIVETQELGANWYISKPSSFSGVKKVLSRMLEILNNSDKKNSTGDDYLIKF